MILITSTLSLFVIYAGTRLLIQSRLESLQSFYRFIARFLITAGFLIFLFTVTSMFLHCGWRGQCQGKTCGHEMHAGNDFGNPGGGPQHGDHHGMRGENNRHCCKHADDNAGCMEMDHSHMQNKGGEKHACCKPDSLGGK
jgi:hypothetical protein